MGSQEPRERVRKIRLEIEGALGITSRPEPDDLTVFGFTYAEAAAWLESSNDFPRKIVRRDDKLTEPVLEHSKKLKSHSLSPSSPPAHKESAGDANFARESQALAHTLQPPTRRPGLPHLPSWRLVRQRVWVGLHV